MDTVRDISTSDATNDQNIFYCHVLFSKDCEVACNLEHEYFSLDFYDYISFKQADNVEDSVLSLPHSNVTKYTSYSYQSMGLYTTDGTLDEIVNMSPEDKQTMPVIAIIQVFISPNMYKNSPSFTNNDLEKIRDDIAKIIDELHESKECRLKYAICNTVNNSDLCVVLATDCVDFPKYLSGIISAKSFGEKTLHGKIKGKRKIEKHCKFTAYTSMGFFKECQNIHVSDEKTVIVIRIKFNNERFLNKEVREKISELIKAKDNSLCDVHMLYGPHSISIRISGSKNVEEILKFLVKQKLGIKIKKGEFTNKKNGEALLKFLFNKGVVNICNERLLLDDNSLHVFLGKFECEDSDLTIPKKKDMLLSYLDNSLDYNYIDQLKMPDEKKETLKYYIGKLAELITINNHLSCQPDTMISANMVSAHIKYFIDDLTGYVKGFNDFNKGMEISLITGIKLFHTINNIITYVNNYSYQSPRYLIEPDESNASKFLLAYSEYLTIICELYYKKRSYYSKKNEDDKEFSYFPKYIPIVIPYEIQDIRAFSMFTLFQQGISGDWEKEISEVLKLKKEKTLFVTCPELKDFVNVKEVIIASMHEIGHYCNFITREIRNRDLIKIAAILTAKKIVAAFVDDRALIYGAQLNNLNNQDVFLSITNTIKNEIVSVLSNNLEDSITKPSGEFFVDLYYSIERLLRTSPGYHGIDGLCKRYSNYILKELRTLGLSDDLDEPKEYSIEELLRWCVCTIKHLILFEENVISKLPKESPNEIRTFFNEIVAILQDLIDSDDKINLDTMNKMEPISKKLNKFMDVSKSSELRSLTSKVICIYDEIKEMLSRYTNLNLASGLSSKLNNDAVEKCNYIQRVANRIAQINVYPHDEAFFIESLCSLHLLSGNHKQLSSKIYDACYRIDNLSQIIDFMMVIYNESIADMVMCKNLGLDTCGYLVAIYKTYKSKVNNSEDSWQAIRRICIVSICLQLYEHKVAPTKLNNSHISNARKYFIEATKNLTAYKDMIDLVEREIDYINQEEYMILIARILSLKPKLKFVDNKILKSIEFVKKYIYDKVNGVEIDYNDHADINFIKQYYYKNRLRYSKTNY